jgi:hypothetical protein
MPLELMAKDPNSGRTGCPSVFDKGQGRAVVWSDGIGSALASEIPNHLPGEVGSEISWQVLCAAVDAYRDRQGL